MLKNLVLPSAVLVCSVAGHSVAIETDQKALDPLAVELLSLGINYCKKADKFSRSDLQKANIAFSQYENHRVRAAEIDQRVLTLDRKVEQQLAHCEAVDSNLQRAKALPILEKGIESCYSAKTLLSKKSFNKAKKSVDDYVQRREAAVSIEPSVVKVGAFNRDIRQCDRLAKKINQQESKASRWNEQLTRMTNHLWKAVNTCEVASGSFSQTSPNLGEVHQQMNLALDAKSKAVSYTGILEFVKNNPNDQASNRIKDLLVKYDQCEELVTSAVQVHEMNLELASEAIELAAHEESPASNENILMSDGDAIVEVNLAQN